jgi:hypothetical protein
MIKTTQIIPIYLTTFLCLAPSLYAQNVYEQLGAADWSQPV